MRWTELTEVWRLSQCQKKIPFATRFEGTKLRTHVLALESSINVVWSLHNGPGGIPKTTIASQVQQRRCAGVDTLLRRKEG